MKKDDLTPKFQKVTQADSFVFFVMLSYFAIFTNRDSSLSLAFVVGPFFWLYCSSQLYIYLLKSPPTSASFDLKDGAFVIRSRSYNQLGAKIRIALLVDKLIGLFWYVSVVVNAILGTFFFLVAESTKIWNLL